MDVDYEKKLNKIKEDLDKAKNLKIRAETRLEQLNQQKTELLEELIKIDVKPEELDQEILKIKNQIDNLLEDVKGMIPKDLV